MDMDTIADSSNIQQFNPNQNLFLQMENERAGMPCMLRENYVPLFVVNLLRQKLCRDDLILNNPLKYLSLLEKPMPDPQIQHQDSCSEQWTDNSLIEEYTDFEGSFLLTEDNLVYADKVLMFAKQAFELFHIDQTKFWKIVLEGIEFPCLEILWLLDAKYQLFSLSKYLMMLGTSPRMDYFQRQFLYFCFSPTHFDSSTGERCSRILNHCMHTFLITAYCNPGKQKSLINLQKSVSELLFQLSVKLTTKNDPNLKMNQKFLLNVLQEGNVLPSIKKKYFVKQLTQLLTTVGSESPSKSLTLEEVIQYQERFSESTFILDNQVLSEVFVTMIRPPLTPADVLQIIVSSIASPSRNWNRILLLITDWIQQDEFEAIKTLKEEIKTFMREGLSSKKEEHTTIAFILARHCSLVAPKIFSRYEQWYSNMFKAEIYTPAKDPDQFKFLVDLLTRWIPFEPSCFLQVQAFLAWPFIPTGCRSLWSDYVRLAKVRVEEYNEVKSAMEFEPNPNNPILADVELTVKEYENTRNIPQRLAHMWMFKMQYYKDQFLPVLLKKPQGTCLSDPRLRLIEALNQKEKIPPEMYAAYKQLKSK